MTNDDHNAIADAFSRSLEAGAPGLSESTRRSLVTTAMIRIRHTLGSPDMSGNIKGEPGYLAEEREFLKGSDIFGSGPNKGLLR